MKSVRVRVYIPGIRKLVLIGSFPNDYQARRARDRALLKMVPGAIDVFPWLTPLSRSH